MDNLNFIETDKTFISPKELSKFINITPGTLAVWRTNHTYNLPYTKIGGRIMYLVAGVNEWLKSRSSEITR